jgi:hypothetical protein
MLDKLGAAGVAGIVVAVAGLALVAWRAPVVAAGLALVLAGAGLVVQGLVRSTMQAFGLA